VVVSVACDFNVIPVYSIIFYETGKAATVHSLTGVPADALLVLATTSEGAVSNCAVSSSPVLPD
jgi:hypothetical protein